MEVIQRILNWELSFSIPGAALDDISNEETLDKFVHVYGQTLSNEIMLNLYNAMAKHSNKDEGLFHYKCSITLEKCKRFKLFKGEYLE